MIFEDAFTVEAPVQAVWKVVSDPAEAATCFKGVDSVSMVSDGVYDMVARASVAFMSFTMPLRVTITEIVAPRRMVAVGDGVDPRLKERVKLKAELDLQELGAGQTRASYRIDLTVSGKLASMGLTVVKGKAKQMADEFENGLRAKLARADAS